MSPQPPHIHSFLRSFGRFVLEQAQVDKRPSLQALDIEKETPADARACAKADSLLAIKMNRKTFSKMKILILYFRNLIRHKITQFNRLSYLLRWGIRKTRYNTFNYRLQMQTNEDLIFSLLRKRKNV